MINVKCVFHNILVSLNKKYVDGDILLDKETIEYESKLYLTWALCPGMTFAVNKKSKKGSLSVIFGKHEHTLKAMEC